MEKGIKMVKPRHHTLQGICQDVCVSYRSVVEVHRRIREVVLKENGKVITQNLGTFFCRDVQPRTGVLNGIPWATDGFFEVGLKGERSERGQHVEPEPNLAVRLARFNPLIAGRSNNNDQGVRIGASPFDGVASISAVGGQLSYFVVDDGGNQVDGLLSIDEESSFGAQAEQDFPNGAGSVLISLVSGGPLGAAPSDVPLVVVNGLPMFLETTLEFANVFEFQFQNSPEWFLLPPFTPGFLVVVRYVVEV